VSERGLPIADGANACPFVAFEDDRDERASVPDHRHRCYAEVRPAPRALAHQEAYCLSSAFPVCPTFQDWARRESARARDAAASGEQGKAAGTAATSPPPEPAVVREAEAAPEAPDAPPAAPVVPAGLAEVAAGAIGSGQDDDADDQVDPGEPRRNPPRDWSAPPPWLASAEAAATSGEPSPPGFLSRRSEPGQGLAGSAADRLAGGPPPRPPRTTLPMPAEQHEMAVEEEPDYEARDLPRPAVPPRRPRAYNQHLGGPTSGPDWERPRRYEAYPTIRTRMGMPAIPRLAVMAAAIGIAALVLFFLPALLGLGSDEQASGSPTPSAAPSQSAEPTATPAATPVVYTIKKGDTLSKIAIAHGVTMEELLASNPAIKDPNKITEGQQITIPVPEPAVPDEFGGSPSPDGSTPP
jgi:hypothetical protein